MKIIGSILRCSLFGVCGACRALAKLLVSVTRPLVPHKLNIDFAVVTNIFRYVLNVLNSYGLALLCLCPIFIAVCILPFHRFHSSLCLFFFCCCNYLLRACWCDGFTVLCRWLCVCLFVVCCCCCSYSSELVSRHFSSF